MPINAFSPEKNFLKWSKSEVINFLNRAEFVGQAAWYIENILSSAEAIDIFSNPNLPADVIQAILQHEIVSLHKLIKIITYDASDLTVSSDTTLSGVNRYKGLGVSATLTVDGQPGVLICDYLKSNGTISKTKTGGAGGWSPTDGDGGDGGGGLIIITNALKNSGLIDASGGNGGDGTDGDAADGGNGGDGLIVKIFSDKEGSGGNGGGTGEGPGSGHFGGGGGQGSSSDGGDGGSAASVLKSTPEELYKLIKYALIDWYIENILGKELSSATTFPDIKGAGGGGGGKYAYGAGGGGGGSGGEIIILVGESFDNTGTIRANGGNGGNGGNLGDWDGGGGGGGGGVIYIFTKKVISQGTIQALGGAKGSSGDYLGEDGSDGTVSLFNIQL